MKKYSVQLYPLAWRQLSNSAKNLISANCKIINDDSVPSEPDVHIIKLTDLEIASFKRRDRKILNANKY